MTSFGLEPASVCCSCVRASRRDAYGLRSNKTSHLMTTILEYKVRIKEWEKKFASEHGKPPSKSDVKADPDIRKAYKVYNELKKAAASTSSITEIETAGSSADNERMSSRLTKASQSNPVEMDQVKLPSLNVYFTDDEEMEKNLVVFNAELGPTPQANGKVLSLFDLLMSPPDSSPVNKGSMVKKEPSTISGSPLKQPNIFKTPTKLVKRIEMSDITPSRSGSNLMEKLRTAASPSVGGASNDDIMETPFYLGNLSSKFSFNDTLYPLEESPSKAGPAKTPEKPTQLFENFLVSPSPLKSQRHLSYGSCKKVSQIFQEFQNLAASQDFEEQKRQIEEENKQVEKLLQLNSAALQLTEAPSLARKRKKALTQKRTTRRWKIKPRYMDDTEATASEGMDVHKELGRLKKANYEQLQTYLNGDMSGENLTEEDDDEEEEEDDDNEDKPILRNPALSTKINPISNNYQRLKINDPRAKKFKQRMKRR